MDKDKIKYDENGYVVIDDFLPVDVYNEIVDIFHQDKYILITFGEVQIYHIIQKF